MPPLISIPPACPSTITTHHRKGLCQDHTNSATTDVTFLTGLFPPPSQPITARDYGRTTLQAVCSHQPAFSVECAATNFSVESECAATNFSVECAATNLPLAWSVQPPTCLQHGMRIHQLQHGVCSHYSVVCVATNLPSAWSAQPPTSLWSVQPLQCGGCSHQLQHGVCSHQLQCGVCSHQLQHGMTMSEIRLLNWLCLMISGV